MGDIFRRRVGVVVVACHPAIGPLYWRAVDEFSVGSIAFCTLTRSIHQALLLEPDWRALHYRQHHDHVQRVIRDQARVFRDLEYWGVDEKVVFEGDLDGLHRISGQSEEDFYAWILSTTWIDVPGPILVEERIDHGFFETWEPVD